MEETVKEKTGNQMEMEIIKDLVELLKQNQRMADVANVLSIAAYVKQMEDKLDTALQEITLLKNQLNEKGGEDRTGSFTQTLKESASSMEGHYQDMKKQMAAFKLQMQEKAKELVTAVRQKGKQELNRISEFFKISEKLEKFRDKTKGQLSKVEDTLGRIDAFGKGMEKSKHEAANAVRALAGKEGKEYEEKIDPKIEIIKKPFVRQKENLEKMLNWSERTLNKCNQLSQEVQAQKLEKAESDENIIPLQKGKSR